MKNTTTVQVREGDLTVGIDLADRYSQVCILDGAGDVIEESRLRTTEAGFCGRFSAIPPARIIIEVGGHSPWVSRLLKNLGHDCLVANPRRVRAIAEGSKKNDRVDAETLARLGRADLALLSAVQHRSEEAQADLALIHTRRVLVAARTMFINRARALTKSFGAVLPKSDARSFPNRVAGHLPERLKAALAPLLSMVNSLNAQISELDSQVEALINQRYPQARLLQQVPGIGPLISVTYVLTLGDPARFTTSRQVGAYLGLVPRQRSSGDRKPELSITKEGNIYMRQLLVNGAHYVLGPHGPDSTLRRWGLAKAEGGKGAKKRAIVAVARKLAVLLHRLWVTGEVYQGLTGKEAVAVA